MEEALQRSALALPKQTLIEYLYNKALINRAQCALLKPEVPVFAKQLPFECSGCHQRQDQPDDKKHK